MAASTSTLYLERINTEFESSFITAATVAIEMGCLEEGEIAAKRVFSYNPSSVEATKRFPQFAQPVQEICNLINNQRKLLDQDKNKASAWWILGCGYLMLGDFPNSFAAFAHSMRAAPNSSDPCFWYTVGIVYGHYLDDEQASLCLQKVVDISPEFIYRSDIFMRLGIFYRSMGKYKESVEYFRRIRQSPPEGLVEDDILLQIAYTFQLAKEMSLAHEAYYDLYQRNPNSSIVAQHFCVFLLKHLPSVEIAIVQKVIESCYLTYPRDPAFMLIDFCFSILKNDTQRALELSIILEKVYPENAYLQCFIGQIYLSSNYLDEAIVAYQKSLYMKNDLVEAWLNLGTALDRQKSYSHLLHMYKKAKASCPGVTEFDERIRALEISSTHTGKKGSIPLRSYPIVEVDILKLFNLPCQNFSTEYRAAVPKLPGVCFGSNEISKKLEVLSTFPKSLFV